MPGAEAAVTGSIDVEAAFAQRTYMTSGWDDRGQLPWLDGKGITLVRGRGRLDGPRRVVVGERVLVARRAVVLATGTSAVIPPIPGLREADPWDNRDATAAKEVPRRLVVLGGGAIGAEMAQAFRRLGAAQVSVVEGAPRLLSREEAFAGAEVKAAFEAEGIRVVTGVAMSSVTRANDGSVVATLADASTVSADQILVAVGRRPKTADLGLDTVGLTPGLPVSADADLRRRIEQFRQRAPRV